MRFLHIFWCRSIFPEHLFCDLMGYGVLFKSQFCLDAVKVILIKLHINCVCVNYIQNSFGKTPALEMMNINIQIKKM